MVSSERNGYLPTKITSTSIYHHWWCFYDAMTGETCYNSGSAIDDNWSNNVNDKFKDWINQYQDHGWKEVDY